MAESMNGLKRTHRCGELSIANVGETVTIMGWVQKNRNKGGLVFIDVRDRSGIIQVVFEEGSTDAALIEKAAALPFGSNLRAGADYRRHLARVLARRALKRLKEAEA